MTIWDPEKVPHRHGQCPAPASRWDECIEFTLLITEWELTALELVASDNEFTIAQMIRQFIEVNLACEYDSGHTEQDWSNTTTGAGSGDTSLVTIRFLLPRVRLAEVASKAIQCQTTPEKLIRGMIWRFTVAQLSRTVF